MRFPRSLLSTGCEMALSFWSSAFRRDIHVVRRTITVAAVLLSACTPTTNTAPGACARPDMAFAGDVLLHQIIQSEAAARPTGFGPAFQGISRALSRARVSVVNLEGPTARSIGPNGRDMRDPGSIFDNRIYSGFPRFNYHPSIADVLRNAGVDVVQTANNHALDRGPLGVDRTLQVLAGAALQTTGTRQAIPQQSWHTVRSVGDLRVAFLACTYSTNGLTDIQHQVLGCYGNSPSVPNLIQSLVQQGNIDAVVLLPHWGTEYSSRPTQRQRRLAQAAADAGAVAVVGAHPHVLQPIELITAREGRQVPVAYSLGNLISSQWTLERRTGAILYLDLGRDGVGRVVATSPRYVPTRVERFVGRGVAVFPAAELSQGAASLAHAQRILGPDMVNPDGCLSAP